MADNPLLARARLINQLIPDKIWITNKHLERQRLTLNKVQQHYVEHAGDRNVILKSRRMGMTTLALAQDVVGAAYYGERCFIISHKIKATRNLLTVGKQMVRRLPANDRITLLNDNIEQISFKNSDGFIVIGSAKTADDLRSWTLDRVHWTEPAFAEDEVAYELFPALREAASHGIITLESTANGAHGLFWEKVMEALEAERVNNPGDWRLHFYPWWWGDDNEDAGWTWDRIGALGDEEAKLVADNDLRPGHIAFRRRTIRDIGEDRFFAEYPESVAGAFMAVGGSFFSMNLTRQLMLHTSQPLTVGEHGLAIWEQPQIGCWYAIGADVGGGGEARLSDSDNDLDASAASVLCVRHGKLVARWQGLTSPEHFARMLAAWGEAYNDAYIAPERNGFGQVTCQALEELGYPNLHTEQSWEKDWAVGYNTNYANRPTMLADFREGLASGALFVPDPELVQQLTWFVGKKTAAGVKYAAPKSRSDDLLMACAIAWAVRDLAPSPSSQQSQAWQHRPRRWESGRKGVAHATI